MPPLPTYLMCGVTLSDYDVTGYMPHFPTPLPGGNASLPYLMCRAALSDYDVAGRAVDSESVRVDEITFTTLVVLANCTQVVTIAIECLNYSQTKVLLYELLQFLIQIVQFLIN